MPETHRRDHREKLANVDGDGPETFKDIKETDALGVHLGGEAIGCEGFQLIFLGLLRGEVTAGQ